MSKTLENDEQITSHNAEVVAAFMGHCKENGVEIPDNLFESFFNA